MAVPRASVRVKLEGGGGPDITVLAETEGGSGARGIVRLAAAPLASLWWFV